MSCEKQEISHFHMAPNLLVHYYMLHKQHYPLYIYIGNHDGDRSVVVVGCLCLVIQGATMGGSVGSQPHPMFCLVSCLRGNAVPRGCRPCSSWRSFPGIGRRSPAAKRQRKTQYVI